MNGTLYVIEQLGQALAESHRVIAEQAVQIESLRAEAAARLDIETSVGPQQWVHEGRLGADAAVVQ